MSDSVSKQQIPLNFFQQTTLIIMKNIIPTLSLCFFAINFFAQPSIQWQKCFGGTSGDNATEIQQTTDGGYVVIGKTLSVNGNVFGNHGGTDFWAVKMDSNGTMQWQKPLGGSNNDWGYSIQQTNDEGYIVAGLTESNNGNVSGNHGQKDIWVAKLNSLGVIQWQRALGGTKSDEAWCIRQTSDNGYIIAGGSNSSDGDITGNHGYTDFWVVKLTESGMMEWQKSLGGSMEEIAYSVRQTADGGYIVTGVTDSNDGDVTGFHGNSDYWIVKLSGAGELEWQKTLGTTSLDRANDISPTSDGGYIVVGQVSANNGDVTGYHSGFDIWAAKLNGSGEIQWQKSLGGSGEEYGQSVRQTYDGGYIVTGRTNSTDGDVIGNDGGADIWIVKLTSEGEIHWQKTLGGTQAEWANSIQQTIDGGFVVAGDTWSNDGDVSGVHGQSDFWVVKLSPSSTPTTAPLSQTLEIFPNPASNTISFLSAEASAKAESGTNESFTVIITDLLGRELSRQSITNNGRVDIAALPNGLYLLTATTPSGKIFSGKFRKQE